MNEVNEEYMKKLVAEAFARSRGTLIDALQCEDYNEEGLLELTQLYESISSVNEDLEGNILDYMLYYVFVRSQAPDRMDYKVLIDMLDEGTKLKERA